MLNIPRQTSAPEPPLLRYGLFATKARITLKWKWKGKAKGEGGEGGDGEKKCVFVYVNQRCAVKGKQWN